MVKRDIPLNLPPNASEQAFRARLRVLGVKEHVRQGRSSATDPDFSHDIADIKGRATPHIINTSTGPVTVSVKMNTIVVKVDDNDELIGFTYQED